MNPSYDTKPAPGVMFRVGRKPKVWTWTELKYSGQGRWDDPERRYAVLYASGSVFGAYLESLSQFQPDLELVAQLKQIRKNAAGLRATVTSARVPEDWRRQRLLARGAPEGVAGPFVAVGKAGTLAILRRDLASVARGLDIEEIDAGIIRLDHSPKFRTFTQAISRYLFQLPEGLAGIFYLGQHGDEVENYALFQRTAAPPVDDRGESEIRLDDQDFLRACSLLGIQPL
jgi:hypothetical protein